MPWIGSPGHGTRSRTGPWRPASCRTTAGIVAFEGDDHEITHRRRLEEGPLVDAGLSTGLVELLAPRAVQLAHQGPPCVGLSGQDGKRDCNQGHGTSEARARPSGGPDSPLALRDLLATVSGAARAGTRGLPCLPPMPRVCARSDDGAPGERRPPRAVGVSGRSSAPARVGHREQSRRRPLRPRRARCS